MRVDQERYLCRCVVQVHQVSLDVLFEIRDGIFHGGNIVGIHRVKHHCPGIVVVVVLHCLPFRAASSAKYLVDRRRAFRFLSSPDPSG